MTLLYTLGTLYTLTALTATALIGTGHVSSSWWPFAVVLGCTGHLCIMLGDRRRAERHMATRYSAHRKRPVAAGDAVWSEME